jgi:predicted PurR-regulated permease PerM
MTTLRLIWGIVGVLVALCVIVAACTIVRSNKKQEPIEQGEHRGKED